MSHCPSCGRFVGPYEACPYCGARLSGRTPIRAIKIAAILLATVGLVALWFAATRAQLPVVQIGQAGATMNMAYVRLEGHCTQTPSYDPESDYLSFWLADDTGEILVSAYRAETRKIIDQDRVPALGDLVEVAGTLRVREDFLALTINVPEQLHITRPDPAPRDIGTLSADDQYARVRVQGQVREIYQPYEGLTLITVRDETGSIPIAVSEDLIALSGVSPTLSTGQLVEVVATVSLYGDTPQLVPASVADIVPLEQETPAAPPRRIGELSAADVGRTVAISGTVTEVDPFSEGVKYTLDDGSGTIVVLLWQSVVDALPYPDALGLGADIEVQGPVSEYQGQLEVIPELARDVRVIVAAPPPAERTIGSLTSADVGREVILRGTLGEMESLGSAVRFPLSDEGGTITLFMWNDVYEAMPQADHLAAGTEVQVQGQIQEYEGQLEIVPQADGISILE